MSKRTKPARGTKAKPAHCQVRCDFHLDKIGVATILFALRYLQGNYEDSGYADSEHVKDVQATQDCTPLSKEEIGQLAELLNTRTVLIP
jgi:hypothetical protein